MRDFLKLLKGGRTKVVLGVSESGGVAEKKLLPVDGKENRYVLGGLDPESRTVLAEKILAARIGDAKRIAEIRQDGDFGRLMKLLAGVSTGDGGGVGEFGAAKSGGGVGAGWMRRMWRVLMRVGRRRRTIF